MRAIVLFSRLIVGSLFIVSGLIKANDSLGFSYKLEEYFAESALNLPGLAPWALALAVLACLAEIVLGFAVLFGGRMKLATIALFGLTVFFGWLTLYTATCDPQGTYTVMVNGVAEQRPVTCVTDCGCFGDAMKGSVGRSLTPWESFYKDAILFVFILPILFVALRSKESSEQQGRRYDPAARRTAHGSGVELDLHLVGTRVVHLVGFMGYALIKRGMQGAKAEWATAGWAAVITLAFTWWCYAHLPVRDYRPYAEGKSISEQKAGAKAAVTSVFLSYKNINTGEVKEYDTGGSYPWNDSNFVFVENSNRVVVVQPGIESQVQDFRLTDRDGVELTDGILAEEQPMLLVLCYNVKKSATGNMPAIAKLAADAEAAGWYAYGMSANGWDDIEDFRHAHQLAFPFAQGDEKVIKTMARANPAVLLLKKGRVMGIWHGNDAPTLEEAKKKLKD
ncbi:MAG: DoxX family membrane protein [Flavobacteriales bacterium]|nr:DoxX family membrane protein [Flavobacteriales bacterium]